MPTSLTLTTADSAESWPLTVPTRWADVSLAQFVALQTEPGIVPAEILCGLPAGTLPRLSVQAVLLLGNLLAFATDPADVLALPAPADLADVGSMPYGTLLLAQAHFDAYPNKPELFYGPHLLALYRISSAYGKAEPARVAACEAALLAAPITEVYGELAFMLGGCKNWLSGTPPTPTMPASPKTKKLKPALKKSASASGGFSRWMRRLAAPS